MIFIKKFPPHSVIRRILYSFFTFPLVLLIFVSIPFFETKKDFAQQEAYWLLLKRTSNVELLYYGTPGDTEKSILKKTYIVKSGIPGEKPTPLPQLVGKEYWQIIDIVDSTSNPETSPIFMTLDIPYTDQEPYGPVPYEECNGQCNWRLPGAFGLHGIAGDKSRIEDELAGSSGCIRHFDQDIVELSTLLKDHLPVRYYVAQ